MSFGYFGSTGGGGGGGDFDLAALQAVVEAGNYITIDEHTGKMRIAGEAGLPDSIRHDIDGLGVSLDGIAPMSGGLTFDDTFENTFTAVEDAHILIFDVSDFTTKIWEVHELTPWVELDTLVLGDWIVTTLDAPAIQSAQIARIMDLGGGLLAPVTVNEQSIFNRYLSQGGHPMIPLAGASMVGVDSSAFAGNLTTAIETVQDFADEVDTLSLGGGAYAANLGSVTITGDGSTVDFALLVTGTLANCVITCTATATGYDVASAGTWKRYSSSTVRFDTAPGNGVQYTFNVAGVGVTV